MFGFKTVQVQSFELAFLFKEKEFIKVLPAGKYRFFDPFGKIQVDIVSKLDTWIIHPKLDLLIRSNKLPDEVQVIDLKDYERALVWVDKRFYGILAPAKYAYTAAYRDVKVEVIDTRNVRFEHDQKKVVLRAASASKYLDIMTIHRDHVGVMFTEGKYIETLPPGEYAFWKGPADVRIADIDQREKTLDIAGQEIMTLDKVTLRLNAMVTYKYIDARKAVSQTEDAGQALYREAQFVLRSVVGARDLDNFLTEKEAITRELETLLRPRAERLGLEIASIGIKDVILPGDMKELMNKVTEARKAAEANLIMRREETAAARSQVNTAKLLQDNPVLMRMRELEMLEKIASAGKLSIVLGEKGLADRVTNLL